MIERRKYKRIPDTIQVKYEIINDKMKVPYSSYTKDISAGGFLIRINSYIPVNSIIKLKFYIKDHDEFIPAEARVVRIQEIVKEKLYDAGIEFVIIEKKDFDLLSQYVTNKINL
ncbi:MAG TPA: PilZ domain-containing protein [Spirochaetota bacterium]|nr:PilZ domain-containing protein [Spirochaetota bacterium]HOL57498.1 PilZ domain-containing protein [Spirochaetota bacterium]HPP04429.1 PilZ domain-containing protein [Spirochaetota bacterium]